MTALIISGGDLDYNYCEEFIKSHVIDVIIAADRGMQFCYEKKIQPDFIIGDYDSVDKNIEKHFRENTMVQMETYQAEKDATDTQIAVEKALCLNSGCIYLLGAMGGRMDHFLSNLQLLKLALDRGVRMYLADARNLICLLAGPESLTKEAQMGRYVSFLPFTDVVEGVTLTGFKYPLMNYRMTKDSSIGVSNEIEQETAKVDFRTGLLLMIQSRD